MNWDARDPTADEIAYATRFFERHQASFLFSAAGLHTVPITSVPEVAFLGRSNVGKSSLLNALLGTRICFTSKKPGRTRTLNAFAVGGPNGTANNGRITVLDMPGYGHGSRQEWGENIMKYLTMRKELKRAFVLIDVEHGMKETDKIMLQLLKSNGIPHQVLLSKADKIFNQRRKYSVVKKEILERQGEKLKEVMLDTRRQFEKIKEAGPPPFGQLLAFSTKNRTLKHITNEKGENMGISAIRWAILVATGMTPSMRRMPIVTSPGVEQAGVLA